MTVEEDSKGRRRWKPPVDTRPQMGQRTTAKKEKVKGAERKPECNLCRRLEGGLEPQLLAMSCS